MSTIRNCIAAAVLLSGASAHVVMNSPPVFPGLKVQSSPLGSGIQFPCQFGASAQYDFSNSTKVAAGSSTLLSFTGSAVHGGGACQVSIAKKASSDPKDWKVIHSIIGGCPATITQSTGNLDQQGTFNGYPQGKQCSTPDSDETDCVKQFNIQIPKDVPSGQYFFAWSWFNKVGNREMYMNCAPLEVTGGASSDAFLDTLPSMFMANVDGKPCTTTDTGPAKNVLDIPNPGTSVSRSTNPADASNPDVLGSCKAIYPAANAPAAGGSSGGGAAPAGSSAPAASAPVAPPASGSVTATSIIATVSSIKMATGAAPTDAPGAPPVPAAPSAAPSAAPVAPAPVAAAPANGTCANSCPTDGSVVCIGSSQFGICDRGCAVAQSLAAGTYCASGTILRKRSTSEEELADLQKHQANVRSELGKRSPATCLGSSMVCLSPSHFGICNNGYALPQSVAPGTECIGDGIKAAGPLVVTPLKVGSKRHFHMHKRAHGRQFMA